MTKKMWKKCWIGMLGVLGYRECWVGAPLPHTPPLNEDPVRVMERGKVKKGQWSTPWSVEGVGWQKTNFKLRVQPSLVFTWKEIALRWQALLRTRRSEYILSTVLVFAPFYSLGSVPNCPGRVIYMVSGKNATSKEQKCNPGSLYPKF